MSTQPAEVQPGMEEEGLDDVTREMPAANGAGSSSILSELRKYRDDLGKERHLVLEIEGYGGLLYARFKYVKWESLKRITDNAEKMKSPRKELLGQADVLINACEAIVVDDRANADIREDQDEDGYYPINPELDHPTRFDFDLAKALGFDDELEPPYKAREILFMTFLNDLAVSKMFTEVMDWASSNQPDVEDEFAGK